MPRRRSPPTPPLPRDLVSRYRAGEAEAMTVIFRSYRTMVRNELAAGARGAFRRPAGSALDSAEIDDLVQEVFIRAFAPRTRASFEEGRPLAPFLVAIARNLLIDRHRKWRRNRRRAMNQLPLAMRAGEELHQGLVQPSPEEAIARQVDLLPPTLRAVYESRFVRDLSQRDCAAVLGLTRRKVRTLEAQLLSMLSAELPSRRRRAGRPTRDVST